MSKTKGGFTLPGEAGCEELTLRLAEKWGADVIRDSDGTQLSEEILNAGYGIYSTICIIRDHNEWAEKNRDKLQQSFLMTEPVTAVSGTLLIHLMRDFFGQQFEVNGSPESLAYWQVFDRTSEALVPGGDWQYDPETGNVLISRCVPFHEYTVSFLTWRIWEEISMYNHVTNHWNKEHLMPVDPIYPETQEYLLRWMENWCESHPATTVVRFTSLFYNFVWIWGSDERNRNRFTDWASYDFTVSAFALNEFEKQYGYRLSAEDFVNQGRLQVTHMPATKAKRDWMDFICRFVVSFGKKLVDIVHRYGKKAYVFYDDSWVGLEPYGEHFTEFSFDGLIKCVFSGYEVRLCSGAAVPVHEIRLHPYLFPVGLGGLPTFAEGGDPARDALKYWASVRRGLLRAPIDRIGLGGYLHLTEEFPDFQDCIEKLADEFREIRELHRKGRPRSLNIRIAVLHYWGRLRSWTLSGHFHETYMHDLIHINEALAGFPAEVDFIDFRDAVSGALDRYDVVINAGRAGDAWSGGDAWNEPELVAALTEWVYNGGCLIGVNEPSAVPGFADYFRLSRVLGVDRDTGARVCHGRPAFTESVIPGLLPEGVSFRQKEGVYLSEAESKVLYSLEGSPCLVIHESGRGKGIYLSSFEKTLPNTRMLLNLILFGTGHSSDELYLSDNPAVETACFPESGCLLAVNNAESAERAVIRTPAGDREVSLPAFGSLRLKL